jgi:hypothetical protein
MPPFLPVLFTSLVLVLIGAFGLTALFIFMLPTLGPRWLFFFLTTLTASGLALPIVYFLNRRFMSQPPATAAVVVRQAIWFGILTDILLWLQLGRILNLTLTGFLVAGFVLIEFMLRLREKSRFAPNGEGNNG